VTTPSQPRRWTADVVAQRPVAASLFLLETAWDEGEGPRDFLPGQFVMVNPARSPLVLPRPLSILDLRPGRLRLLYRVVGGGTAALRGVAPGESVDLLGPLGHPFPAPGREGTLLLAGGVGLPPLLAWERRWGRAADAFCFGARTAAEVPWTLLGRRWQVSVDSPGEAPPGREVHAGTVVALGERLAGRDRRFGRVLACGPVPMLRAAADLAARWRIPCDVSVEQRMGCGYGACRGCIVPTADGHHVLACREGPVLPADRIDWQRFGVAATAATEERR